MIQNVHFYFIHRIDKIFKEKQEYMIQCVKILIKGESQNRSFSYLSIIEYNFFYHNQYKYQSFSKYHIEFHDEINYY